MKRLSTLKSLGSWKSLGIQGGLLAGLGTAFVASPEPDAIAGPIPACVPESMCSFLKPNFMFVIDYSASMNMPFGASGTRWDAVITALNNVIDFDQGFLHRNLNLAVLRFGHDPVPGLPGSLINNDISVPPLVDGVALDIHWFDNSPGAPDTAYIECNGEQVKQVLNNIPPPVGGMATGIGTWTKGGLDLSRTLIAESRMVHGESILNDRLYANIVLTDGQWTGPDGITMDPLEDPALTASDLFNNLEVKTHVVAVADAGGLPFADQLAAAGGTIAAVDGSTPQFIIDSLVQIVDDLRNTVLTPECIGGMPRIMVILDGSSSMLNVAGLPGMQGQTGWDQARDALAGPTGGIFDIVTTTGDTVEDLSQLGLMSFGSLGEEAVLVDYGVCMKDNFAWALDPNNSCVAPGCTDPWAGPPITWTTQDGSMVPPMFDVPTISHMPSCDTFNTFPFCTGSATYTHAGLDLAFSNQQAYYATHSVMGATDPVNPSTLFFNILITDGAYDMFSTDAQVQTSLETMYNAGITTYVIGFGDFTSFVPQLADMANWGSMGTQTHFTAANQTDLEMAMQTILNGISFDPCCGFNDCSLNPEPTTNEPDPVLTSGDGDGDGDGDGTTATGDGDGDGTSGDGDGDGTSGDGDGDGTSGDGDGTSGDGDGTTGDGDGTSGDGDGTTTSGDGDGTTTSGDGDGDSTDTNATGDGDTTDSATSTTDTGTDTSATTDPTGTGDETTGATDTGLDDGCNCSTNDDDPGGGGLAALFGFSLLGLGRRRRKRRS